jgi:hypothetical protein
MSRTIDIIVSNRVGQQPQRRSTFIYSIVYTIGSIFVLYNFKRIQCNSIVQVYKIVRLVFESRNYIQTSLRIINLFKCIYNNTLVVLIIYLQYIHVITWIYNIIYIYVYGHYTYTYIHKSRPTRRYAKIVVPIMIVYLYTQRHFSRVFRICIIILYTYWNAVAVEDNLYLLNGLRRHSCVLRTTWSLVSTYIILYRGGPASYSSLYYY